MVTKLYILLLDFEPEDLIVAKSLKVVIVVLIPDRIV